MKKKLSLLLAVVMIVSVFCLTGAAAANTTEATGTNNATATAATDIGSSVLTVKYTANPSLSRMHSPLWTKTTGHLFPSVSLPKRWGRLLAGIRNYRPL